MIKQELIGYLINYYLSTHPSVEVVKGAVIFGLNPCIIRKRISKYTIGVRCNVIWNDNKHGNHPEKNTLIKKINVIDVVKLIQEIMKLLQEKL